MDMGSEHEVLRTKKLKEEKFVLDLLTIVLSNGQQYNLLSQVHHTHTLTYTHTHIHTAQTTLSYISPLSLI